MYQACSVELETLNEVISPEFACTVSSPLSCYINDLLSPNHISSNVCFSINPYHLQIREEQFGSLYFTLRTPFTFTNNLPLKVDRKEYQGTNIRREHLHPALGCVRWQV